MTSKHGDRPVLKAVGGPPYLEAYISFALSHKFLVVHPCIVDPIESLFFLKTSKNLESYQKGISEVFSIYWGLVGL